MRGCRLRLVLVFLFLWPLPSMAETGEGETPGLVDHDGRDFRFAELHGSVVLLIFGFTHCPDICPVEMARTSAALRELAPYGDRVRAVFITVDPQRDSPAVIRKYIGNFHPGFIGVSGTQSALDAVADRFRVKRMIIQSTPYLVDHGTSLYILNQGGEAEVAVMPGLPPAHIVSVVESLLGGAELETSQ